MISKIRALSAVLAIWVLIPTVLLAQAGHPSPKSKPSAAADAAAKVETGPRFDVDMIDKTANPCVDFYQYACGNWMKKNPIPGDRFDWDSFAEIYTRDQAALYEILEKASANDPKRSPAMQTIGDYYASCMDEGAADKAGWTPLKPELDRIAALQDKGAMMEVIAHEMAIGPSAILSFYPELDPGDPRRIVGWLEEAPLTLPDRAFYLQDRADVLTLRGSYTDHMTRMFVLIGEGPEQAARSAQTVLKLETELAGASMDRAARSDPTNVWHQLTLGQLEVDAPNFAWKRFFAAVQAPPLTTLIVPNPDYFKQASALIASAPLDDWKTFLRWRMLHRAAPWLSSNIVAEDFQLRHKALGEVQQQPRWKRCLKSTDELLGDALGQAYVEQAFSAKRKQQALKIVEAVEAAMRKDIQGVAWMSEPAKKEALAKLAAVRNKIGYPEKWRDYSGLKIVRGDLLGNYFRANEFDSQYALQKIGTAVDDREWKVAPQTLNGYRDNERNELVFPAGILQPPLFDPSEDDAVNFGAIGFIIAHELTHGFDDRGRLYDASGRFRDWWTAQDAQQFEKRTACFTEEYNGFLAADYLHVNGQLTLAENVADNGAARVALMALHDVLQQNHAAPDKRVDGFTVDQRFFLGMARVWCQNRTLQYTRMAARTNEHAPGRWRTNGVVENMPEFQKAFGCKPGQPMVRENACRVW